MIKMMILAPRRVGMSHAEFRRYVTDVHGPLVKSVTEVAADIRRYHYNFPIAGIDISALAMPLAPLDIITEAWFDSIAAQRRNMEHPRYMQVLRPDEERFADGQRALVHYTTERVVIDGARTAVRLFVLRRRHATLTRADFQDAWQQRMQKVLSAAGLPGSAISCYVQNHTAVEQEHPDGSNARYFDVIDQYFLPDQCALGTLPASLVQTAAHKLLLPLLDTTRGAVLLTEVVKNI
jgi:hypothetical protein